MSQIENVDARRVEVQVVKHFLEQNNLRVLKFDVSLEAYKRGSRMYGGAFPIYLRNHDQSTTVVYVDSFLYSISKQVLTVRVEELLKHL